MSQTIYDIAVVGGGPAGMTAALYGARAGKSVILFEGETLGGQIVVSERIENYPALPNIDGFTFAQNLKEQIEAQGVIIVQAKVTEVEKTAPAFSVVADQTYTARSVILATGLKHRKLGVSGEEELIGRGVSFCATCDGRFYRNREVAVIGGGNTAVQDALTLSEYCSRVYLIHRRMELRAEEELVKRLDGKENIEFIGDTVVEEMQGTSRLEALSLKNLRTGAIQYLPVAGAFEAIGYIPQNQPFQAVAALDEYGYFLASPTGAASTSGVFVAGDACQKSVRQLTTAVSDGTVAALFAVQYLDAHKD